MRKNKSHCRILKCNSYAMISRKVIEDDGSDV